jgi:hypothetical protein
MHWLSRTSIMSLVLALFCFASELSAQVCTLSVTGLNRYRQAGGFISAECGGDLHSAPFGNWGVTSSVGTKQDSHQFDGWCRDAYVCDNSGNCRTKCRDGWYEWNSCTSRSNFSAPNCTLYNAEDCTLQVTSQDVNIHGTAYAHVPTSCPFDSDGDRICDTGGCKDISSYSQTQFMSVYELDFWDHDDIVQTLYFPEVTVSLRCDVFGCPIAGSQWARPAYYDSPGWPPIIHAEAAIVVGWGLFRDPWRSCNSLRLQDPRYNCF